MKKEIIRSSDSCNENRIIFICEDTIDGLFTAVYKAWEKGTAITGIEVKGFQAMQLFCEYEVVETDAVLAAKVADSIRKKISNEVYNYVFQAALSDCAEKGQYIYEFLQKAFRLGPDIVNMLSDDTVMRVFEMTRKVNNESHRYLGFVRFEELANGVLASRIDPKANVIPLIADHFGDRLHNENWIILDTNRRFAAIHRSGHGYILSDGITDDDLALFSSKSENEEKFRALWQCFFDTIAIEERKNRNLQRQMMPLRYRRYM